MTVSTTINKVFYIGNGVATTFAIPFPFLKREHLKVHQLLNNVQTERSDWTISGGNLVFSTAPANGAQIVIMREVPLTQETDYRENEVLPAETLERNFDKLTMQVQQLKEQADRAVTVDIFDDTEVASLIPSIRQSVSDAAAYASTATQEAQTATIQAGYAASSAQSAEQTEERIADLLESKADKTTYASKSVRGVALWADSPAALSEIRPACIIESYKSGFSWYRVWSDGWTEQGGITSASTPYITFLKPFSTADYHFAKCIYRYGNTGLSGTPTWEEFREYNRTTTGIQLYITNGVIQASWTACGYGA